MKRFYKFLRGKKKKNQSSSCSSNLPEGQEWTKSAFAEETLRLHNHCRAIHQAPPLALSQKLNNAALEWATKLVETEILSRSPNTPYGENLFMVGIKGQDCCAKPKEAVECWYEEAATHRYFEPQPSVTDTAHFSQMVWKDTKYLGVGVANSKNGKCVVVCFYEPKGNYLDEFDDNCLPPAEASQMEISSVK